MVSPATKKSDADEATQPLNETVIKSLVSNHRRFLHFLEKRVGNTALAEEILQTAFVKTIESGGALTDGEGAVAWFYRLLRNALVDHYRRQDVERRALQRETSEATFASEIYSEIEDAICKCLNDLLPTLKPEYAELVKRVDLDGESISEIANSVGMTANNAMVKLHRARQALKRQLERSCGTCATHGCLDCACGGRA
jgi:RNA polymerase sigma factor (sigma-70 family)